MKTFDRIWRAVGIALLIALAVNDIRHGDWLFVAVGGAIGIAVVAVVLWRSKA